MSFLFNFASDEDASERGTDSFNPNIGLGEGNSDGETIHKKTDTTFSEAKEVTDFCDDELISKFELLGVEFGQNCLKIVDTSKLGDLILKDEKFKSFANSENLVAALSASSDLVAGVYEGGLKMWECGDDLTHFLISHPVGQAIELKGKSILELGCGAGLPGVYCCTRGAQAVHFQDFNEEVLQLVTHTNATLNIIETEEVNCRYFSGDWSSLSQLLQQEKQIYDVILTAETIYSSENYPSLHDVFSTSLSSNGIIVVAAKVYYFGVGGGTDGFIEYVESRKRFTAEIVHTIKTGVPRKIIILRRQESDPLYR
ncbi:hypothetical protein EGW08_012228 [Elysia chlorotica]|uniref:protein-histidine N-methyltransferase n=1 Tax=Elysia chlorotica TaxID=188477 RepID=A0A3S1BC26_ELYCH|nr:hypothetical protein EGW08_012228 [Elysia chlorotica]